MNSLTSVGKKKTLVYSVYSHVKNVTKTTFCNVLLLSHTQKSKIIVFDITDRQFVKGNEDILGITSWICFLESINIGQSLPLPYRTEW